MPSPQAPSSPSPELDQPLEGFIQHLTVECGLSHNTCLAYRRDLNKLVAFMGDKGIGSYSGLHATDVEAFVGKLGQDSLATPSVRRALAATRMFCRYLVLERVMPADVSAGVQAPKKWQRLPRVMSDQTVRQLMAQPDAAADRYAARDHAILTFLYATGVRASELVGLQIGDINVSLGIVRVIGKGNKERIVPVAGAALAAVQQYLDVSRRASLGPNAPLFVSRSQRPLRREDLVRIVRKYVYRSGVPAGASPHTFRHSFATQLVSGGADLRAIQEMLGHADISTTQIYTHVDGSRLRAVHRRFHPRG